MLSVLQYGFVPDHATPAFITRRGLSLVMEVSIHQDPFEYTVVDNFMSDERFAVIKELADEEKSKFEPNCRCGKYIRWVDEDLIPESEQWYGDTKGLKKAMHWAICPPDYTYELHIDPWWRLHTMVLYIDGKTGTQLHSNDSEGIYPQLPNKESNYVKEVEWKENRLFLHNPAPKTWHTYATAKDELRVVIQAFLIDPKQVPEGRGELDHLIDPTQ